MAYSFPFLKVRELSPCLGELGIQVTPDALKNPTPILVRGICESFLHMFTAISPGDIQQMNFDAMSCFEHPSMHEDAIHSVGYNKFMIKMFEAAGVVDFSLHDILKPDSKRTRVLLSALVNFAKYRESKLGYFQELTARNEDIIQQAEGVNLAFETTHQRLAAARARQAEEAPHCEALQGEIGELTASIQALNEKQCELQAVLRASKKELTETADVVAKKQFGVKTVLADCDKLQTQIVQSPERIKREIVELSQALEVEKENVNVATRNGRELKKRLELFAKVNEGVEKTINSIEQFAGEVEKCEQVQRQHTEGVDQIEVQRTALRELTGQEQQLKRQHTMAQEKLVRLNKQQGLRVAQVEAEEKQLNEELAGMQSQQQQDQAKSNETDAQCEKLQTEMGVMESKHQQEMDVLGLEFSALADEVASFHTRLFEACARVQ